MCAFCDQRSITGKNARPSFSETERIIEEHLETLGREKPLVAFFGGSFTGIGKELMEGYLKAAYKYVKSGEVSSIRLSTRPDYIDDSVLDILERYAVTNIELGAQSMDDDVLKRARRGHDAACVERASEMIRKRGFVLGLQMMLGLPGDSFSKSVDTAKKFVALGAEETRIYPTVVIRGTLLEKMYESGEFVPMTMDETLDTAAECYGIFEENNVAVLRIGLQNSKELEESVVAGAYHDALGERVLSRRVRNAAKNGSVIEYSGDFLSKVIGQKKENILCFEKMGLNVSLRHRDDISGVKVDGKYVLTRRA